MTAPSKPDESYFWNSKIGSSLDGLELFYHTGSDKHYRNPIFLNIILDGSTIGVSGNPNGEGLRHEAADVPPVTCGLLGEIAVRRGSDIADFAPLLGSKLRKAALIMDIVIGDELGLRLCFDGGQLLVLNIGDELFVRKELPNFIDKNNLSFNSY